MSKYLLKPKLGTIKQGFFLEDENNKLVYEGKMIKFSLFGASPFEFINHITGKVEEHKVGKTITVDEGTNDFVSIMSRKSYFKFDDKKIWEYLHDLGIRIDSKPLNNKVGMSYDVSFEGKPLAVISSTSPRGKSFVTTDLYYDVECNEKDLDLVFLVAFSIAKTEQVFYD